MDKRCHCRDIATRHLEIPVCMLHFQMLLDNTPNRKKLVQQWKNIREELGLDAEKPIQWQDDRIDSNHYPEWMKVHF